MPPEIKGSLPPSTKVGVVVNAVGGYSRGVLRGVASFAAARAWTLRVEGVNESDLRPDSSTSIHGSPPSAGQGFPRADWAGFIVQVSTPEDALRFARTGVPVVNVSSSLVDSGLPTVITDDAAVGRLGADHLIRLGFRTLVFHAPDPRAFAHTRFEGFSQRAGEAGLRPRRSDSDESLYALLQALPGPLAVMGCNDRAALGVLDACRAMQHKVPEDVAVIGVDDDDLVQALAYPPLSSVNTARDRVGFEAGALLERLILARTENLGGGGGADRSSAVPERLLVAPKGVVARRSTDSTAIADGDVAAAARFIHAQAGRPISVDDVALATTVSRRQLERRFKSSLGRSILDEITRCRIDRARQLLIDTDLTLEQVALASGFSSGSYFSVVFKRSTGNTPQRFRDSHREWWRETSTRG